MLELLGFISSLITLYIYIIVASAVMSWLIAFNVVNPYNQFVRSIWQGLNALTEPLLRPIRRMMPDLGGIDISPVVLILICAFIQGVIIPGNEEVKEAARLLQEHNFDVRPILYPTVKRGQERLRIVLHSFNTENEIDQLLTILESHK